MKTRLLLIALVFLLISSGELRADTLYLKNGRSIEGFIQKEENNAVIFDVGCGTVTFQKREIERIERSTSRESALLREQWQKDKAESEVKNVQMKLERERLAAEWEEKRAEEERQRIEALPRQVSVDKEQGQIVVNALLNGKARASLVLDTGASLILLTKNIARALGIAMDEKARSVELQMADGSKTKAQYVILESVKIEGVEAESVGAAILWDTPKDPSFKDGLLGMSFLSRFNFTVDHKNEKLILRRLR
ncbi:MAG: retropepsin-like aspartic protease [Candidatus Omnitrophota bacterium]|jgi:clan AA aspartic protease (TIGR02281 family)